MRKKASRRIVFTLMILFLDCVVYSQLQFDRSEYAARRQNLMATIPDGIAVIRGAKPPGSYMEYYQNNDFMYLTGVEIPNAILIVDGKRKECTLFFTISESAARSEGISLDLVRNPVEITGIERVRPIESFSSTLNSLSSQGGVFYTPFEPEELMRECSNEKYRIQQREMILDEWDGRLTRELQFVELLKKRFPMVEVRDCSQNIWNLRSIKSPAEIELMRKAGKIAVNAHIEMMKATRPGMYEYELAALFEYHCKKEGAQDLAYYAIICSGPNHPYLHYYKHDRQLKDGDFLVIDVGPDVGYYDIDITVSYPVNGKFSPRQKEVYEAANAVHEANMQVYRPGLTAEQCRKEVEEILIKQGFDLSKDYFQRMRGGFGHFVGMAIHDVGPRITELKAGMVIANEPLAVWAEEELGVRVEDTILITDEGCENLTAGIPRTVEDIEALMRKKGTD